MIFGLIGCNNGRETKLNKYDVEITTLMPNKARASLCRTFFVKNFNSVLEETVCSFNLVKGERIEKIVIAELKDKK